LQEYLASQGDYASSIHVKKKNLFKGKEKFCFVDDFFQDKDTMVTK